MYQTILVEHRDGQGEAESSASTTGWHGRQALGERKKAVNMFEKALEIDPGHGPPCRRLVDLRPEGDWEAVIQAGSARCMAAPRPR